MKYTSIDQCLEIPMTPKQKLIFMVIDEWWKKMNIKKTILDNKEGIIIGAIVGYVVGKYFLPADLDFFALFHGVDERVPISAIEFGVEVLKDFLENA